MTNEVKLKPCPFCGSTDVAVIGNDDRLFNVECSDCGILGPVSSSYEYAVLYWNNRPREVELFKKIEKIRTRLMNNCHASHSYVDNFHRYKQKLLNSGNYHRTVHRTTATIPENREKPALSGELHVELNKLEGTMIIPSKTGKSEIRTKSSDLPQPLP